MSKKLQAKVDLCHKYQRWAKVAKSKTKRKKFNHKAEQYRFQAENLIREIVRCGCEQARAGKFVESPLVDSILDEANERGLLSRFKDTE